MKQPHSIVIVDDDNDDREILRDAFASSGGNVDFVLLENGERLLDYLATETDNGSPSLIMLDLNMPGKDGRETLRELRSDPARQTIPVIVFTTSSSQRDRQAVYEFGANCFVTKPDTFNKLVEITAAIGRLWLG